MYAIDRFMIAGYSVDAMNAVVLAGNFVSIFSFMLIGIASSAEIFAGQYNGAKQYKNLASPTWQMIYMSIFSYVICFFVAYFSDYINMFPSYYREYGVEYQKILMYSLMLPPIKVAFTAFFVGQGKTKIVTVAIAVGVVVNVILDYILIYGVKDIISPLGCRGAAIATVIAELTQVIILAIVFFSKDNRKIYGTYENRRFNKKLFFECCEIGIPMSLGNFISLLAWYLLQYVMSNISKDIATIYSIGISIYIFFLFVSEGICKGVSAVTSNMIAIGDVESIEKVRKIFVRVSMLFGVAISAPLVMFPEMLFNMLTSLPDDISRLYSEIKIVCYLVAINSTLEALLSSHWGILVAGGDIKHVTIVYESCMLLLVIFPVVVLFKMNILNSVPLVYVLMGIRLIVAQFFIYKRYRSLKWYKKLV
jgi:MATE family multidrug resistance protein